MPDRMMTYLPPSVKASILLKPRLLPYDLPNPAAQQEFFRCIVMTDFSPANQGFQAEQIIFS
jgi:hypothetical protein